MRAFQIFINTYPNSDRVAQCNRLIDELRMKQEMKAKMIFCLDFFLFTTSHLDSFLYCTLTHPDIYFNQFLIFVECSRGTDLAAIKLVNFVHILKTLRNKNI